MSDSMFQPAVLLCMYTVQYDSFLTMVFAWNLKPWTACLSRVYRWNKGVKHCCITPWRCSKDCFHWRRSQQIWNSIVAKVGTLKGKYTYWWTQSYNHYWALPLRFRRSNLPTKLLVTFYRCTRRKHPNRIYDGLVQQLTKDDKEKPSVALWKQHRTLLAAIIRTSSQNSLWVEHLEHYKRHYTAWTPSG